METLPCKNCLVFPICNSISNDTMRYEDYINTPYIVVKALIEKCELLHKYLYGVEGDKKYYSSAHSAIHLIYDQQRFDEINKLFKIPTYKVRSMRAKEAI